jgi:hypothetical protein
VCACARVSLAGYAQTQMASRKKVLLKVIILGDSGYVCACMHACVRVCMRAPEPVCARARKRPYVRVCVCVCVDTNGRPV